MTVRLRDVTLAATARVLEPGSGAGEDQRARTLVFGKYQPRNGGLDGWREQSLPVAIDVIGPE